MARPTKLNNKWLEVAEEIVNDDINAIILTDEEMVLLINEQFERQDIPNEEKEKQKISDRTFKRWKKKNKEDSEEIDEIGKQFCHLIKKALLKQKRHLFDKFRDEEGQWQKWAWIIERKFDDWNIKYKYDHTSKDEQIKSLTFEVINGSEDKNNTSIPEATESTDEDSS